MIALDSNVLLRYLVGDVPEQEEAARSLIDSLTPDHPGFICREVVQEIAWVLERTYRLTRPQVAESLLQFTYSDTIAVENNDDVATALDRYGQGGVGLTDLMVLAAAWRVGALPLHTFDRALARLAGATLADGA